MTEAEVAAMQLLERRLGPRNPLEAGKDKGQILP